MAITPIGVVLIPLAVGVALFWPQRLLSLLIVLSVFNAASVVNVYLGAMPLGLQPYYLVAFLIAVQAAWSALEGARWLPRKGSSLAPALRTLCKFWLWCVVTAFVLPIEFRGLPVLTPRSGIPVPMGRRPMGRRYSGVSATLPRSCTLQSTLQSSFTPRARRWLWMPAFYCGLSAGLFGS